MSGARARRSSFVGVLAGLAVLASGCGGSKSPAVASLRTTTSSTGGTPSSRAGAFALPPGGAGIGASMSITAGSAAGVKFTACMRSHGVPGFPDPDAHGTITVTVSRSLDPSSPVFRRAEAECQHLLPAGKAPSSAQQQRMKARALAFAACMRTHGVTGYPDPKFGPGGAVSQGFSRRNGIDPRSPVFQAAQRACQRAPTTH
jgi:hypothetical protein